MTHKHVFENVCTDFSDILAQPDFKRMLRVAKQQSKSMEAKLRTDISNYKDYGTDEWSPIYFGMFVEWYAEQYLNFFGHLYNIADVKMFDAVGSTYQDLGVDGMGVTMCDKKATKQSTGSIKQGGPVYIQVKGTLNFNKEHQANDGSRLPNFTTNAMSSAIRNGTAYYSRYVLFTTCLGIHYKLKAMWNDIVEVIDIKKIHQLADHNQIFLNAMRVRVGLEPIELSSPNLDAEASFNLLISEQA